VLFEVFPNPTETLFNIRLKAESESELVLTNMLGRKVWQKKVIPSHNEQLIKVYTKELGLQKGEYLLTKHDVFGTASQKLIVK
jgi:hypothetical protein